MANQSPSMQHPQEQVKKEEEEQARSRCWCRVLRLPQLSQEGAWYVLSCDTPEQNRACIINYM